MNTVEVKNKLKRIIREMLLSDLDSKQEIPERIINQILGNYGCTSVEKSDVNDDMNSFLINLQKWIEDAHFLMKDSYVEKSEAIDCDLSSVFEKYLEAEKEYCEVISELTNALEEIVKQKETYSLYFKNKCKAQETNMEVLSGKCQFLKLQFFIKLYGEENALRGHLALREKLKEELDLLKINYSELEKYNKSMSEIKTDKTFCELFKVYKELRKIEQRTEIIGQM